MLLLLGLVLNKPAPKEVRATNGNDWGIAFGVGSVQTNNRAIASTSDGGLVTAGYTKAGAYYNTLITKVYPDGSEAWSKSYGQSFANYYPTDIIVVEDGYLVTGYSNANGNDDFWVMKINFNGVVQWQYVYGGTSIDRAYEIASYGSIYIVVGSTLSFGNSNYTPWLIEIDSNGTLVNQFKYTGSVLSHAYAIDVVGSDIFLAGSYKAGGSSTPAWVMKLDTSLTPVWEFMIGSGNSNFNDITHDDSGNLYLTGQTTAYGSGNADVWTMKLNSSGAILWQNVLGKTGLDKGLGIELDSNGDVIVAGWGTPTTPTANGFVAKLSGSSGSIIWQKALTGYKSGFECLTLTDEGIVPAGWINDYFGGSQTTIKHSIAFLLDENGNSGSSMTNPALTGQSTSATTYTLSSVRSATNATAVSISPIEANTQVDYYWFEGEEWGCDVPDTVDTDGDALPDVWETCGVDTNGDSILENNELRHIGADPNVKDIFIEVDWMECDQASDPTCPDTTFTHQPNQSWICEVAEAFARTETQGIAKEAINLHVDFGPNSLHTCGGTETFGIYSGGNALPWQEVFTLTVTDNQMLEYNAIRATEFETSREGIFHYFIIVHEGAGKMAIGVARSGNRIELIENPDGTTQTNEAVFREGSDSVIFAFGNVGQNNYDGSDQDRAGIFMHELGHNLGLTHHCESMSSSNGAPNCISVMNYNYTVTGVYGDGAWGYLDYSPFTGILELNETALLESSGIISGTVDLSTTAIRFFCDGDPNDPVEIISPTGSIDWNCDGQIDSTAISADISNENVNDVFFGNFNEWNNLVFSGGEIGLDN
ncbi:hypothetical protein KC717_00580 [Candidatus Dojkabacteria bacterium]|uniref:Uncharacterized protein n=1 Tax=Candidatus Dojkabacteria bacterium TaxID=2099670 RepID=A0A955RK87_9BACT|nr:hypothetical protein [Candidatus Dojkabacteria bacterium]